VLISLPLSFRVVLLADSRLDGLKPGQKSSSPHTHENKNLFFKRVSRARIACFFSFSFYVVFLLSLFVVGGLRCRGEDGRFRVERALDCQKKQLSLGGVCGTFRYISVSIWSIYIHTLTYTTLFFFFWNSFRHVYNFATWLILRLIGSFRLKDSDSRADIGSWDVWCHCSIDSLWQVSLSCSGARRTGA